MPSVVNKGDDAFHKADVVGVSGDPDRLRNLYMLYLAKCSVNQITV